MATTPSGIYVGEALIGEGNEIAHVDLLLGPKSGHVGQTFCNTLTRQTEGHSNLLAVLTPNQAVKPDTVTFTKVTIKGAKQAVQMFGPAQTGVAFAVAHELDMGTFDPLGDPEEICIIAGIFIHWDAADNRKIMQYNYEATRLAVRRAINRSPNPEKVKEWMKNGGINHPFQGKDVNPEKDLDEAKKRMNELVI